MLINALHPLEYKFNETLTIYRSTVIKRAQVNQTSSEITSIEVVQRLLKKETLCEGYDKLLHEDVLDWYAESNSTRYNKRLMKFTGKVFIDASDWGELMAVSRAHYIQGLAEQFDGDSSGIGNDRCGQSMVFAFTDKYLEQDPVVPEPSNPYPVQVSFCFILLTTMIIAP